MVHPGLIVAGVAGVVATGVVLYVILREEIQDLFEKPSAIPGDNRHFNSRRKSDSKKDDDSYEGYTTARSGAYDGYELRSRRIQSDNEKENDEDDDEHNHLLNRQYEINRREQELADKMARLDEQERLLNEREERLMQQLTKAQETGSVIAPASLPSPPKEQSQSNNQVLMPSMDSALDEQYSNHGSFADSHGPNQQQHPLQVLLSCSQVCAMPAPLPTPPAPAVDTRSSADAILGHDLSEQRNPFEESSIYMDVSSSSTIREDTDDETQGHYQEQQQQPQQEQQHQPLTQANLSHDHDESAETDHDGGETASFHGGASSDPDWVEADVDSDLHSNFSDYDDWSSSSALSP